MCWLKRSLSIGFAAVATLALLLVLVYYAAPRLLRAAIAAPSPVPGSAAPAPSPGPSATPTPGQPAAWHGGPIPGNPPAPISTEPLRVPGALARGPFLTRRMLTLPTGFHVAVWATGLNAVRFMALGPQTGDVYATVLDKGTVLRLSDPQHTGVASVSTIISGLDRPHGITWNAGALYVAENGRVLRLHYNDGDATASGYDVVSKIVAGGGHVTRTILFGPDKKLYVSAGSSCNVCRESDPQRAAITRFNADGSPDVSFAKGLRNAVGLAFLPDTGDLWATVNGRDGLGDDTPPDQLDLVRQGNDFGWPACHGFGIIDPQFGNTDSCKGKTAPMLPIQAHSAPLGLRFYVGTQFPVPYRGDLFIALHGSWDRKEPTGAKVIRVHFSAGKPAGATYENFLTGFQLPDGSRWGRPVDLLADRDGGLLLSDDASGSIYRIAYDGA